MLMKKLISNLRIILRIIKKILPEFLPIPYFHKFKLKYLVLPKHHWTQYIQNSYEKETFAIVKDLFKKNNITSVWDVGANVGMFSVYIAKRFDCIINAFEPVKKYNRILKSNTSSFSKVNCHEFGLGGKYEKRNIILTEEPGSNYIHPKTLKLESNKAEECVLKSIKNLLKLPAPDLLKLDVEGYEYEVLSSFIDYLKYNKTIIIVEINENHLGRYKKNKKDIIYLLSSRNYKVERILNSKNFLCKIE